MSYRLEQREDSLWVLVPVDMRGFCCCATPAEIWLWQQLQEKQTELQRYRAAVQSALSDLEAMGI